MHAPTVTEDETRKRKRDDHDDDSEGHFHPKQSNVNADGINNDNSNDNNDDASNMNIEDNDYGYDYDDQEEYQDDVRDDDEGANFCDPPSITLERLLKNVSFYGYILFESKGVKVEFETPYTRSDESQGISLSTRLKSCKGLLNTEYLAQLKIFFCSEDKSIEREDYYASETDANWVFLFNKENLLPILIFSRENFITTDVLATLKEMVHDSYERSKAIDVIDRQQGKVVYDNGDVYRGDKQKNKPEGQGTYTFKASGDVYTGSFKNGEFNGDGKYTFKASGAVYTGSLKTACLTVTGSIRGLAVRCMSVNGEMIRDVVQALSRMLMVE